MKTIIRHSIHHIFSKKHVALFEFLFEGDSDLTVEKLKRTYEGDMCLRHGLKFEDCIGSNPNENYIFLVPDYLRSQLKGKVHQMQECIKADNVKFESIYWLYLSVYFIKELPLKCFQ